MLSADAIIPESPASSTYLLSPAVAPETPETMPKIAPSPSFTP